ncbi:MAG TPA: energy transducer TonB [Puia sp.]|jgi:protein TonB|nr:energy transducer TonB [Puia sp.]
MEKQSNFSPFIIAYLFSFVFSFTNALGSDTLYFRLSNPWNTVKDPNGSYLRKCVPENDYYHIWDYNGKNILVTESYYADTTFKKKLLCHKYFNEQDGLLEQTRCYKDGRLNGYIVDYNKNGDTTDYQVYENGDVIKSWSSHPQEKDTVLSSLMKQEVKAEFPGGRQGWIDYLSRNLQYPPQLKDSGITGQVILKFTITPKGKIEDIIVVKSLHPLIDKEAIRVISESPKWKPAEQLGKKVPTTITQPIDF